MDDVTEVVLNPAQYSGWAMSAMVRIMTLEPGYVMTAGGRLRYRLVADFGVGLPPVALLYVPPTMPKAQVDAALHALHDVCKLRWGEP